MENILLGDSSYSIPEEICENKVIFNEIFSLEIWNHELTEEQQQKLMNLMPHFPENDSEEKQETLKRLFDGENFKFGNQLNFFFKKLNEGFLSPALAKLGKSLKKAAFREYRLQEQHYFWQLLQPVLLSRKLLLEASQTASPDGPIPRVQQPSPPTFGSTELEDRTRWRYFTELQDVREECGELETSSEDENYPGPPPKLSRKHKKHLQFLESSLGADLHRVTSTTAPPPPKAGHSNPITPALAILELTEDRYRAMLQEHQQRRLAGDLHPELDTTTVTLEGVMQRAAVARRTSGKSESSSSKKKSRNSDEKRHRQRTSSSLSSTQIIEKAQCSNNPPAKSPIKDQIASSESFGGVTCSEPSPIVHSSSAGHPALVPSPFEESSMAVACIPVAAPSISTAIELPQEEMEVDVGSDVEGQSLLVTRPMISEVEPNAAPTSFFALLRDLFYELPEQKMSVTRLEDRVRCWMENPLVPCADWLQLFESWVELVSSALKFLAGDLLGIQPENFVPYLDYREKQQQWQWIGAGRDSDDHLNPLCQHWLENKDDLALESLECSQGSPPPARVATDWTVKPTNEDERVLYRQQECVRYENPHKAFTFKVHGYESVVGPVKGVYGKDNSVNKAREHSLLISDRPPFVTILSLVRDSAARLPNGEGTRADICELLKDSQYLSAATDQQIHTVVSGALDRLHYEKDPCVKYDTNRKLWIYLHRHRTEEEFEKIHQAQAAAAKAKKAMQKNKTPRNKSKDVKNWTSPVASTSCIESSDIQPTQPVNQHSPRSSGMSKAQQAKSAHASGRRLSIPHSPAAVAQNALNTSLDSQQQLKEQGGNATTTPNFSGLPFSFPAAQISKATMALSSPQITKVATTTQQCSTLLMPTTKSSPLISKSFIPSSEMLKLIDQTTPARTEGVSWPTSKIQSSSGLLSSCISSSTPSTLTIDVTPSSTSAFVGQPPVLQPIASIGSASLTGLTHTTTNFQSKPHMATLVGTSKRGNLSAGPTLQGFQTIVIKQDQVTAMAGKNSSVPLLAATVVGRTTAAVSTSSKSVVARLMSGTQVVSLGNLMSGIADVQAGTALRFQGGNYARPTNPTASLNLLQTATNIGNRLPKFAVMSPGIVTSAIGPTGQSTVQLSSTSSLGNPLQAAATARALLVDQEKSSTLLTAGGTLKLLTTSNSSATQGKFVNQMRVTGSGPSSSMVTMTSSNSLPNMLLPGNSPVMIGKPHVEILE